MSTHDCRWATEVLLGEAPAPADSARFDAEVAACAECSALVDSLGEIDALAESLPMLTVPDALSERTLAAVTAELAPPPRVSRGRRLAWAGGLALAAAAVLAVMPSSQTPAPPERLVARGAVESPPSLSLKVAVDSGEGLVRHRRDRAYPVGTAVRFRVDLDRPAHVGLVRLTSHGAEEVARWHLQHGGDLTLDGAPLLWTLEEGEHDAIFVVVAANAPLPDNLASQWGAVSGTLSEADPCVGLPERTCDHRLVRVVP